MPRLVSRVVVSVFPDLVGILFGLEIAVEESARVVVPFGLDADFPCFAGLDRGSVRAEQRHLELRVGLSHRSGSWLHVCEGSDEHCGLGLPESLVWELP